MVNLKEYEIALTGAGASVYSSRIGEFGAAVQRYQEAILEYRSMAYPNAPKSVRAPLERKVRHTFLKMQRRFRHELATISARIPKSQKGNPLTHPDRAINIARSSRKATKLNVVTQAQAHNLVKFGNYGRYLGNGMAVIDFTTRAGNVHSSYKSGGNWERNLFIESTSFAASALTGIIGGHIGGAALGFLMVATPLGWAGLIIGGIAVAGTVAGASIVANKFFIKNSGDAYDAIMKSLRSQ